MVSCGGGSWCCIFIETAEENKQDSIKKTSPKMPSSRFGKRNSSSQSSKMLLFLHFLHLLYVI